jgi:hypothetical protein
MGILSTPSSSEFSSRALGSNDLIFVTNAGTLLRLTAGGGVSINGTETWIGGTDNGAYTFQVNGNVYNTTGANVFNASSGETLFGTTSDAGDYRVQVSGNQYVSGDLVVNANMRVGRGAGNIQTNTIMGFNSFLNNVTGAFNVAIGQETMRFSKGSYNVAIGANALANDTSGTINTAIGASSLTNNSNGYQNTAIGTSSMLENTTGYQSVSVGFNSGRYDPSNNILQTNNRSIFVGYLSRASANGNTNEIVIGTEASGNGSNTVTIGNSSVTQNYFRGEMLIGYTSDQGAYSLQSNGNALINGNIRTAAPAGGTANDWRLGTVATVSPTSPNRTIEVSIGGTIYYIHAKTTND